eukprot:387868_1
MAAAEGSDAGTYLDTFLDGFKRDYAAEGGTDLEKENNRKMSELLRAFAHYWMAPDSEKNTEKIIAFVPIRHIVNKLIGHYAEKEFIPGVFGADLEAVQGTLASYTYRAIISKTLTDEQKKVLTTASNVLFIKLREPIRDYTRSKPSERGSPGPPALFMEWLKHVGQVADKKKHEDEARAKSELAHARDVREGSRRSRRANSEYYNELDVFDDSFRYPHHSHLPFDDRNHYQPRISGQYNDVSDSGSSLLIGGVVGASGIVIIMLIFCLGLSFGMIIYWGYSQKRTLDVKR